MTSRSPQARDNRTAWRIRPLVLIVDDSEKNRKLAREVLRAAGFRTLEAARGDEAIAVAAKRRPDLILLDLRLPDMDGTDVAASFADGAETGADSGRRAHRLAPGRGQRPAPGDGFRRLSRRSRSTSERFRSRCAVTARTDRV